MTSDDGLIRTYYFPSEGNVIYLWKGSKEGSGMYRSVARPIESVPAAFLECKALRDCAPQTLAQLSAHAKPRKYPRGAVIFLQDEHPSSLILVTSGWVKLFRDTSEGDEAVVDVVSDGTLLGDSAILSGEGHPFGAMAVTPVETLQLPPSLFSAAVQSEPELARNLLRQESERRRAIQMEMEHRDIQSAPQRLGCFLLRFCSGKDDAKVLKLPYDKSLVAAQLAIKPETFSRALKTLKQEAGIETSGGAVTIPSVQRLAEFACAACSVGFPCKDQH